MVWDTDRSREFSAGSKWGFRLRSHSILPEMRLSENEGQFMLTQDAEILHCFVDGVHPTFHP